MRLIIAVLFLLSVTNPADAEWLIRRQADPITDELLFEAALAGSNSLTLVFSCQHISSNAHIILGIVGNFLKIKQNRITIKLRFDKKETINYDFKVSNGDIYIYGDNAYNMITKIRSSKLVGIAMDIEDGRRITDEFQSETSNSNMINLLQGLRDCISVIGNK